MNTLQGPDWYLAYALDGEQLADAHRAAKDLGLGLVDLSGWWSDGQDTFAALWTRAGAAGGERATDWHRGVDVDRYAAGVGAGGEGGLRPVRQQPYATPDGVHVAAVWRERPTRWTARTGMTPQEVAEEHEVASAQGRRLVDLSGYDDDGGSRYAAVWEEADPARGEFRHDQEHAAFTKDFALLARAGFVPRKVAACLVGDWCSYASVWERPTHGAVTVRRRDDIAVTDVAKVATDLVAAGYRPTQVTGYAAPGGPRLGMIVENEAGVVTAFHGKDPAELRLAVADAKAARVRTERNVAAERQKQVDAQQRRQERHEAEQRRIAEDNRREAEARAERERRAAEAARERLVAKVAAGPASDVAAAVAALAPPTEKVRVAIDTALVPARDVVEGAVAAIVVVAARSHGIDISRDKLAAWASPREVERIRRKVLSAVESRGAAEFHARALHLQDAWHLRAGPVSLDLQGAVTLFEISAQARYDAATLTLAAFFESVSARVSGSAGVTVDGLGRAWAGGQASGPGASGGVMLGTSGAGAQLGVTYGRAEAVAGVELLGQSARVGIGVSAGFELGLQLGATVSLRLGPLAASVPNVPLAVVAWAAGALADLVCEPGKTIVGAVEDVAQAVGDVTAFFRDMAEGAIGIGEWVVDGIGDLLGHRRERDVVVATKAETAADGRRVNHTETFEGPSTRWVFVGRAGVDVDRGYAAHGRNNAWVRGVQGVHAVVGFFDVMRSAPYTLTLAVRTSAQPALLAIGVRDAPGFDARGSLLVEQVGPVRSTEYRRVTLELTTTPNGRVLLYVALVGSGTDSWAQVDDVRLSTTTVYID